MADIIKLLPDAVANQIAAGEVIQRPASAVKELMENAVDAGADMIKLLIKDGGKTLIQVIDNGCGMSHTDARMAFERHATSKIQQATDLFAIRTMGFRGEALASIAAIAQVEMKTRKTEEELGTKLDIKGSSVTGQQMVQCPAGTSISVKNLFFNVPARRNFLKSNQIETRHIIEEFTRIAMANPNIAFSMHHNEKTVFTLKKSVLKQRIAGLLGSQYSQRLVPVEQNTEHTNIHGFIGKPEFARKTRGEQFFFANKRFIKHPYLHHAVDAAFQELLPKDSYPSYFLFIEIAPETIDINIHPTKTEVNFQDNKLLYGILRAAVRQTLGKYNITPSLDFEIDPAFDFPDPPTGKTIKAPVISTNPDYNPFKTPLQKKQAGFEQKYRAPHWEHLYPQAKKGGEKAVYPPADSFITENTDTNKKSESIADKAIYTNEKVFQYKNKYIVTIVSSGILIIDQNLAHARILFEKFLSLLDNNQGASQQELYPETLNYSPAEAEIIQEIKEELNAVGFIIEDFGKGTFIVRGKPADLKDQNSKAAIDGILENYRKNLLGINIGKKINLAQSMAANMAIKPGKLLQREEQNALVDALFACKIPELSPNGKTVFKIISLEEIEKMFK